MSARLWWTVSAGCLMTALLVLFITLRPQQVVVKTRPPDPTRPVFNIEFPAVGVAKSRADAFVLPGQIVVPPRAIVRIKGLIRAESRTGNGLIIAELKVPRPDGSMPMCGNGLTGVILKANEECAFELEVHYPPRTAGPAILEVRLGDEFLATARLKMMP